MKTVSKSAEGGYTLQTTEPGRGQWDPPSPSDRCWAIQQSKTIINNYNETQLCSEAVYTQGSVRLGGGGGRERQKHAETQLVIWIKTELCQLEATADYTTLPRLPVRQPLQNHGGGGASERRGGPVNDSQSHTSILVMWHDISSSSNIVSVYIAIEHHTHNLKKSL